jgi:quercetin dioxygenase-like cupin family protein
MRLTLPGSATGGALAILENLADPGRGPPLHVHEREDEALHLMQGRLKVRVGDRVWEITSGESAFLPRGTPHAWKAMGDAPSRLLLLVTPAGFEAFFRAVHEERLSRPDGEARIAQLSEAAGLHFLGQPLD